MRKRLLRLAAFTVLLPAAGKAAAVAADRLEAKSGPSTTSRSLRQAGSLASRPRR